VGIAPSPFISWRASGLGARVAAVGRRFSGLAALAVHTFLAERDRWAIWLPVALGSGVGIYFALPVEPPVALAAMLGLTGVVLAVAAAIVRSLWLSAFGAVLAALLLGFGIAKLRTEIIAAPVLMHRVGPVEVQARVVSAQIHGKGVRAVLLNPWIEGLPVADTPRRVRVSVRSGGERLIPGAMVDVRAVLLPPPPPAAPGDYDFGRTAFFEGIGAVGYAFGRPETITPAPPPDALGHAELALQTLRFRISAHIHTVLPGSSGAVASALITGDRGGISEADESALRDAGLAHVLAIAGLHMALVGLGLFWAVRAILAMFPTVALTQPIKKWAALAALGGAGFYLSISGAAAPATRAFTMLAMMLLAILFDRPALSMRSLAFAATILLLLEPESLMEPGFQMSFAAVASLIAVAEWEQRRAAESVAVPPPAFASIRRYLRGIAVTSFVGSMATMPYAAFHFDRSTHYAVLGNLLAMPIMGFVTMPAAAFSVLLMPVHLDNAPLHVMGWGIDAMLAVGRFVSHLPGAVSIVSAWPTAALVLLSIGGLWIVIWRSPWRWLGLAPACIAIAIAMLAKPPDVLVARDGQTVAIRGADGLLRFVRPAADEYSASEWLKRDGDSRMPQQAIATHSDGIRCDAFSCVGRTKMGLHIAIVSRRDALGEDCAAADVVISTVPTRGVCADPKLVIDRFDVAGNGAYAVWLDGKITYETVQQDRGARPWSREPWQRRGKFSNGG